MRLKHRLIALVLTAVVGMAAWMALSIDGVRWRAAVIAMKASGQIDGLEWVEMLSMMQPGSPFYLEPLLETPNAYAVIQNPRSSAADREAGERFFAWRCASCHGAQGEGETAPSLVGSVLKRGDSDLSLFRSIIRGIPDAGMLPIPMPDIEAWQIVAYIRSLRNGTSTFRDGPSRDTEKLERIDVSGARIEDAASEPHNWLTYSGSYASWRYSELDEITVRNVAQLKLAWSLQLGTAAEYIETSPIVVDGVMYLSAPASDVVAVDATTGEVFWRHARAVPTDVPVCCGRVNRGVAVLGDQVFIGTLDSHLVSLNARTGRVIWETQVADYREGYSITAAPLAVGDKIIVGIAGGEFGIRGFLDAYDASSGERIWRFYTIPEPGDFGSDTWSGESWRTGGGPTWLTGSFDAAHGLLYWGVGNPAPDFNGDVRPGDNLFTESVVALDIETGERVWHFQFTPHDVHDWDANQIPVLVDLDFNGLPRQLMLWANRNGFYYVLDRVTGEFLHAAPFVTQTWAAGIDPAGRPIIAPGSEPTPRGTLTWPGLSGGANWWSPSYSPKTNLLYVPFADAPKVYFKNAELSLDDHEPGMQFLGSVSVPTGDVLPAGIRALDPVTGERKWEYWRQEPRRNVGRIGGTVTSAGNVVFFGDVMDFVALDAENGRELWRVNLGGHINASPIMFAVDGHQRVAIPAGNTLYVFRP